MRTPVRRIEPAMDGPFVEWRDGVRVVLSFYSGYSGIAVETAALGSLSWPARLTAVTV